MRPSRNTPNSQLRCVVVEVHEIVHLLLPASDVRLTGVPQFRQSRVRLLHVLRQKQQLRAGRRGVHLGSERLPDVSVGGGGRIGSYPNASSQPTLPHRRP